MGNRQGKLITTIILFALLTISVMSGCGNNRKVLSFLFDGVPPERDSTTDTLANGSFLTSRELAVQKRKARADSIAAANHYVLHPPYADGDCDTCHNMALQGNGKNSLPSLSSDQAEGEGWLVAPVAELCITCHDDKSAEYAEDNNLNIHAPVEEGMCTTCHNPHRSRYDNLLLTKTARELCMQCHDESIPAGEDGHPELDKDDDCTMCHTPHLSADEQFLE